AGSRESAGDHARRRQWARAGLSGEAANFAGDGPGEDGPGLDRRPRHSQPGARLAGQHGDLRFQPRRARRVFEEDRLSRLGREVFPAVIRSQKVSVHLFDGYWEDIGTVKAFFEANLS